MRQQYCFKLVGVAEYNGNANTVGSLETIVISMVFVVEY